MELRIGGCLRNVYRWEVLYALCNGRPDQIACWGLARKTSIVRPRDVEHLGVPREYLLRLHRAGQLERIGRGLYHPLRTRLSLNAIISPRSQAASHILLSAFYRLW